ncbi:unnamed protein product [Ilex paraguariensis]|uniref:Uncharacterized protein n=1 Tax=Ilex paraguariensis TaxID=185542 RepID=A0ABC8S9W2_9AQUA
MGRAPCCDKTKVKRGPWSQEEVETLKELPSETLHWWQLDSLTSESWSQVLPQELPSEMANLPQARHQTWRIY